MCSLTIKRARIFFGRKFREYLKEIFIVTLGGWGEDILDHIYYNPISPAALPLKPPYTGVSASPETIQHLNFKI